MKDLIMKVFQNYTGILSACFLLIITSCSPGQSDKNPIDASIIYTYHEAGKEGPKFSFEEESFDFGQIVRGEKKSHTFTFTNSGDVPLVISSTSAGCGCTVAGHSQEPVQPGKSGFIEVYYDSGTRNTGFFRQTVNIVANTSPNVHQLYVTGEIIQP